MTETGTDQPATACSYDLSPEHVQALWLTFQRDGAASCPETGAPIRLEAEGEGGARTLQARCKSCQRQARVDPAELEGFSWAE